jgi:hypothetical protein
MRAKRDDEAMLDPDWTPERGRSHVLGLLSLYSEKPEDLPPWRDAERKRLESGSAQEYDIGVRRRRVASGEH